MSDELNNGPVASKWEREAAAFRKDAAGDPARVKLAATWWAHEPFGQFRGHLTTIRGWNGLFASLVHSALVNANSPLVDSMDFESDLHLLYEQASVFLWSSLENYTKVTLVRLMELIPEVLECEDISKIKISLAEFERLSAEERRWFILDQLERSLSASLKLGVDRFESLLKVFDLDGPVDAQVKQDLFELQQKRNVLMHRFGIADRRIVENCPWLNLKKGDAVRISKTGLSLHAQIELGFWPIFVGLAV